MIKRIGLIVDDLNFIAWFGPLCEAFHRAGFLIHAYAKKNLNRGAKNLNVPGGNPGALDQMPKDQLTWYESNRDLAQKLSQDNLRHLFSVEAQPFVNDPALFMNRNYTIYNLTHSV